MKKTMERRRETASDDDTTSIYTERDREACHELYNNTEQVYSYNSKSKKLKPNNKSSSLLLSFSSFTSFTSLLNMLSLTNIRQNLHSFQYKLKQKPTKTIKKLLMRLGFYIWCFAVVLSVLSLLGVNINAFNPFSFSSHSQIVQSSTNSKVRTNSQTSTGRSRRLAALTESDENVDPSADSSYGFLPSWSSFFDFSASVDGIEDDDAELNSDEDDDLSEGTSGASSAKNKNSNKVASLGEEGAIGEEDIPQQILPATQKMGNTLNKKLEKKLACEEDTCNDSCNAKIKAKCAKSSTCRKDREKICKRRCRKQRCEDRCKDEPKFGYVEREQRMEKCKDDCTGPTAVHNKCIKKCHSQFKPCKSRCHEIASKYICDKATESPLNLFANAPTNDNDNDSDDDDDEDDEGITLDMDVDSDTENDNDADSDAEDEDDDSNNDLLTTGESGTNSKQSSSLGSLSSGSNSVKTIDSIIAKSKLSRSKGKIVADDLLEDPELI